MPVFLGIIKLRIAFLLRTFPHLRVQNYNYSFEINKPFCKKSRNNFDIIYKVLNVFVLVIKKYENVRFVFEIEMYLFMSPV